MRFSSGANFETTPTDQATAHFMQNTAPPAATLFTVTLGTLVTLLPGYLVFVVHSPGAGRHHERSLVRRPTYFCVKQSAKMSAFAASRPVLRQRVEPLAAARSQSLTPHSARPRPFCSPRMVAAEGVRSMPQRKGSDVDLEKRRIGNSGLVMTEVSIGTMTWGHQNSEQEAHEQLNYAYERGVVGIDCAEMYPVPPAKDSCGETERYIGSWIRSRGGPSFREKLVLCSKVAGGVATGRSFSWIRGDNRKVDRANIREAVDGILSRLGTDYIDLLQIHWPDRYVPLFGAGAYDVTKERPTVSFEEQILAMDELIKEGKIRSYGLSNETAWGVAQFDAIARALGCATPASIQNSYSLLYRDFETHLAEACAPSNANVPLLAYSPLAGGALTGKYLSKKVPEGARFTLYPNYMKRFQSSLASEAITEYKRIAEDAGFTLTQLALAWCKSRLFVGSTIIGATSVTQLEENLDSFGIQLDKSVIKAVDKVYTRYRDPSRTS